MRGIPMCSVSPPGPADDTRRYDGYIVNKIDIRLLCLVNSNLTWFWQWVEFRAYWGKNLITSYIYIPAHDQYTGSALYVYRQFHAIIHYIYMYCFLFTSLFRWRDGVRLIGKLPFLYYHNLCSWLSHCQLHRDVRTNAILCLITKITIFNNF